VREDLKKLYTQVIKAHSEAPFHFTKIENATAVVKAFNPICGDRFEIYFDTDSNRINAIHFHGFGCAISKASTSLLVKNLDGKKLQEAISICDRFLKFVNKELKEDGVTLPDEFLAFSGVRDFPERYECAALSWKVMKDFLETNN